MRKKFNLFSFLISAGVIALLCFVVFTFWSDIKNLAVNSYNTIRDYVSTHVSSTEETTTNITFDNYIIR